MAHRQLPTIGPAARFGAPGRARGFWPLWIQNANRRRRRAAGGGSLDLVALDDVPGLLAEYVANAATMVLSGASVQEWHAYAGGIGAPILYPAGDGPDMVLTPDAMGPG